MVTQSQQQPKFTEIHRGHQSIATLLYKAVVRPVLFKITEDDPERAQHMASRFLEHRFLAPFSWYFKPAEERLHITLRHGDKKLRLRTAFANAAGFTKDGDAANGLGCFAGYVTIGTALPYSWDGNKPRIDERPDARRVVRLESEEGMLNCLGFPFGGVGGFVRAISEYKGDAPLNVSIAVRPVKGADQSEALGQFKDLVDRIAQLVGASKIGMIEANFASPNTEGLAMFFEEPLFTQLAKMLTKDPRFAKTFLFLKMPPHLDDKTRERNLRVAKRWMELGGDGLTVTNTVKTPDDRLTVGSGGKSGRPIFDIMLSNLRDYRKTLGVGPIINASGGITPDWVGLVLLYDNADTVQVFTPMVYGGPGVFRDMAVEVLRSLRRNHYESMDELRRDAFAERRADA